MFSIVDYDIRYKPYDKSGGDLKYATWVKLPVKPKGDGLQTLLEYKRGGEVFSIWCLLLQKATDEEPENRGKLLNHRGEPATISEIAKGISHKGKEHLVEYALSILVEMGWVNCDGEAEATSDEFQKVPLKSSVEKSRVVKSKEYTSDFEFFWKNFSGRWSTDKDRYVKVGKYEAFEEWQKLTLTEKRKAAAVADKVSGKFTPDACRWLKRKLFDDFGN